MAIVFFLAVLVDLIVAVGVGLVLASILLTYRMAQQMNIDILNPQQDQVISGEIETIGEKCMRIIRIDGPFFFGSMTKVINLGNELLDTKVVLFDCSKIPFIDSSAVFALEDIFLTLNDKGIKVLIYADNKIIDTIKNLGITNIIPHQHLFNDLQKSVDHAKKHIKECK
ncbi:STAS domain-containing protein [Calditerrivibrio nitroreducens]|uniref:STAS domain-containing protein n=1 Tax=Calditerrivibrio nitroreducens TaxID=477976 RepID=UPI003C75C143